MKKTILTAIAVLALSTTTHAIGAFGINYDMVHINAFYGQRTGHDDYKGESVDLSDQTTYGIDADIKIPLFGFNVAGSVAYFTSDDDDTLSVGSQAVGLDSDLTAVEIRLGLRKYVSILNFGFVVGGGIANVSGTNTSEVTISGTTSEADFTFSGTGGYLEAGMMYKFGLLFNVGAKATHSFAVKDDNLNLGGTTVAAYIGMVI